MYFSSKKKKKLFYHQRTKNSCIIGEAENKFFAIIVNWYKYQLTIPVNCSKLLKIKYNILLRLYLFFQLKNSNSLVSFIILIIFLNEVIKKNRIFDIRCIVKWGGKTDKITFWDAKN